MAEILTAKRNPVKRGDFMPRALTVVSGGFGNVPTNALSEKSNVYVLKCQLRITTYESMH